MHPLYLGLSKATSATEVLQLARDYVDELSDEDLSWLPAECRHARVDTCEDIERWADRLSDAVVRVNVHAEEDEVRLNSVVSHFLLASIRLRQIGHAARRS